MPRIYTRRQAPPAKPTSRRHCARGHELTPDNTYNGGGAGRNCRRCALDRDAARRASSLAATHQTEATHAAA